MSLAKSHHRARELRRRVVIPARLRSGAQWSDACILNISSRGLLIHTGRAIPEGATVEVRRGDHAIFARVAWRSGDRVGLQADDKLPVEEIMSTSSAQSLRLVADGGKLVERRKRPRKAESDSRLRGRAIEFIGVGAIVLALSLGAWTIAERALAKPIEQVEAALDPQS
jgi:hypothetical protein